ncbi:TPA: MFS transporter [Streptococcus suis]|uniref:MFS transporter n=1 Tax=Streptococcus parasuis TaxID=1501662 RepID=UPI00240F9243|nr:MFS transporter [Streptococcus suis]NCB80409.1 MFS transporter [Bacilli bacterium]
MNQKKIFYSLFFNDLLSDFGDTLYYLSLMNYVILLPDSQLALSIITLSETIPIFFKIMMGYLADKTKNKIHFIMLTQVFRFILYLLVGFLISFNPALWVILTISAINLLSDLAGQFENSLYLPIELQLIEEEEREQVFATTQSIASILNILFKLSGAVLVTLISYQALAFINATTFLVCALFMLLLRSQLAPLQKVEDRTDIEEENETEHHFLQEIKSAILHLKNIPHLLDYLLIIACLNGLFSIITPLIIAGITHNKNFTIINAATTISLAGVILTVANILGNISANTIFQNVALKKILYFALLGLPFLFLSFLIQNIWFCFLLLFLLGIASGAASPKFYGFLMNNLSPEKIGLFMSEIGTTMQLGIVGAQLSFSILIASISPVAISYFYLIISTLFTCWIFIKQRKKRTKGLL